MPFCLWKAKNDSVSNFLLVQKLECRLLTAKSRSVRGASRQPVSMGSCLTICPTCLPCPHLLDGWGCSPGLGSGNKQIVKFGTQLYLIEWWLWCWTPAAVTLVQFPGEAKLLIFYCHRNGVWKRLGREITILCVGDVRCLFQNEGNWGCGKV